MFKIFWNVDEIAWGNLIAHINVDIYNYNPTNVYEIDEFVFIRAR